MKKNDLVALLKRSVSDWNQFRENNLNLKPDLRSVDLRRLNLKGVNLSQAILSDVDFSNANCEEANFKEANLTKAQFSETDLTEADLSRANLFNARFIGASLIGANLRNANLATCNFDKANLRKADLRLGNLRNASLAQARLAGANLTGANLTEADLRGADLRGADLRGADLRGADLRRADLTGANLTEADLSQARISEANFSSSVLSHTQLSHVAALGTNFQGTVFTGACLEDWNINSETQLDKVICDYIYLKTNQQERRPTSGNFAPGDFTKLFKKALDTIDLIFREGIDWQAFVDSFKNIQILNEDTSIEIQSIENKGDGVIIIKVNVPQNADKSKIDEDFWQSYGVTFKLLESQYQSRISDKDKEINRLFYLIDKTKEKSNNDLNAVPENSTITNTSKTEINYYAPVSNFSGNVGEVQNLYSVSKNLADAAAEIQQLLNQLEQTYPTNTPLEKHIVVTEALKEIENKPALKARVIGALKAGGTEALKELLDHPAVNILLAALGDWQEDINQNRDNEMRFDTVNTRKIEGTHLDETTVYQEAITEGQEKILKAAVPLLLKTGMTIEQIAQQLNVDVESVRLAAQQNADE